MHTQHIVRHVAVSLLMFLMLSACGGHKKKVEELQGETERLAGEINQVFVTTRENLVLRAKMIQDAYEHQDRYDLSTAGMDVSEGGMYKWFEDWYYIPTKDAFQGQGMLTMFNGERGVYLDPDVAFIPANFPKARKIERNGPEIELIQKEIRLWEHILVKVMAAGEDSGYTEYAYFANPRGWLNIYSMYFDYVSTITAKLTLEILGELEWVKIGTPYGNPDGTPKWVEGAMAGMSGEGWVTTVGMPIYAHNHYIILANGNVYPLEFSQNLLTAHAQKLLFLDSQGALLGMSSTAKEAISLKELTDYDYVKQMQENAFLADEFKLTHESQNPGVQELGTKVLAGEILFDVIIDGADYTVVVSDIPEVNFYVVGLVKQ